MTAQDDARPRVIAIASQKGGVGKTTITVQLGAVVADTIAKRGEPTPVLGVSVDPQASMLEWAEKVGEQLPFDFAQCADPNELAQLRRIRQYRYIFVDTPGSLQDETAVLDTVLSVADEVIVPIEPEPLGFKPARRTIRKVIEPAQVPYRVLINNWDTRDSDLDVRQTQEFCAREGFPVFSTVIRHFKLHARAAAQGVTAVQFPGHRMALEARQDFLKLSLEVVGAGGGLARHALRDVNAVYAVGGR